MNRDPVGVSGTPAPAPDCDSCATPYQGLDLMTAGRHGALRGTRWFRHERLGKLRICRQCDRLWSEHFDTREKYTWHRHLGWRAWQILAEDSSAERVVQWSAAQMPDSAVFWPAQVLREVLQRYPDQMQAALDAIVDCLAAPIREPGELAAIRRNEVLKLTAVVIDSAVEQSGKKPPYPRVRPDRELLLQLCRDHQPDRSSRSYFGKAPYLIESLAERIRWKQDLNTASGTVRVKDLVPLIDAMAPERLTDEQGGYSRGYRLRAGWKTLEQLLNLAVRPATRGVVSAPAEAWQALDRAMDPVRWLDRGIRAIFEAETPSDRLHRIQEEEHWSMRFADLGARLNPAAVRELEELSERMRASDHHPDRVALNSLMTILKRYRRLSRSDCQSEPGTCLTLEGC